MYSEKILIVEDDANLREALSDTLGLAGYHCTATESAEAALSKLSQDEPGLIVSDINLGGMNGHELLSKMQRDNPAVPVLLMTAYGNISSAVQAMRDGAVDYLIKTI